MTMRMPVMEMLTMFMSLGWCLLKTVNHFFMVSHNDSLLKIAGRVICSLFPLALCTTVNAAIIQGDAAAGKLKTETCKACHGVDGAGILPSYPNLGGMGDVYLVKQITDIRDGNRNVPEMKGMVEKLTDQDIADIAAWYASKPRVKGLSSDKTLALGWKLFNGGSVKKGLNACAGCHSPTGIGVVSAGFPALAGQNPEYIIKQLTDFRDSKRTNDMNGMMRDIARKLSNQEIEALANYVHGLYQ